MLKNKLFISLAFLCFAVSVLYAIRWHHLPAKKYLTWDEVDYATAAQQGLLNNALAKGSVSFFQFLEIARGKQSGFVSGAKYPSERNDPFILRHFHPVLPVYYWSFFSSIDVAKQDFLLRLSSVFVQLFCIGLMLIYSRRLWKGNKDALAITLLIVSVFVSSQIFTQPFLTLNFHIYFLPASILFVFFLIRYLEDTSKRNVIQLAFVSAILIYTLETFIFIFVGAMVSIVLLKKKISKENLLLFVVALAAIMILLFPGVLRTLEPVKSWAMYAYRLISMKNEEYKSVSVAANAFNLVKENYWLLLLIAAGYIKILTNRKMLPENLIPLVTGLIYLILILPFSIAPSYLLPAMGLLFIGCMGGVVEIV
jgi:hypothetical protein